MSNGDETAGQARILLEEARWRRDDQATRQAALNQRLATLFALNFAVLAILGASLRFGDLNLPAFVEILIYVTIANLLLDIAILLWALRVGRIVRRPDLDSLRDLLDQRSELSVVTQWTAREIKLAVDANEAGIDNVGKWLGRATIASLLAVILVALVISLAIHFGTSP